MRYIKRIYHLRRASGNALGITPASLASSRISRLQPASTVAGGCRAVGLRCDGGRLITIDRSPTTVVFECGATIAIVSNDASAAVRDVMARITAAWRERRYDDLAEVFAEDMVFTLPGFSGRLEGRE